MSLHLANRIAAEYSNGIIFVDEGNFWYTHTPGFPYLIKDVLMSLTLNLFLNIMSHSIHQYTLLKFWLQLQKSFALVTTEEPELHQMTVHQNIFISCCWNLFKGKKIFWRLQKMSCLQVPEKWRATLLQFVILR